MSIKQQIDADLKSAMLSGEKEKVTTLRGLKSVILYSEVSSNTREQGLSDEEVIALFRKESKKRQESADLYEKGNNLEKKEAELREKIIIEQYLPAQMSEEQVGELVDRAIAETGADIQNMGKIIGLVKTYADGNADGSLVAKIVRERLS